RQKLEVAPQLDAVGATDLAGLDAKVVEVQELESGIKAKDTAIESLGAQINPLTGAADALRQAMGHLDSCRTALGDVAIETLSADLDDLDVLGADPFDCLRKRRQQLSRAGATTASLSTAAS